MTEKAKAETSIYNKGGRLEDLQSVNTVQHFYNRIIIPKDILSN